MGNLSLSALLVRLKAFQLPWSTGFLTPGISQEQRVRKETKDNGGLKTEHEGRSGTNFSQRAATSNAEVPETLAEMC